jgi:hypothetical protein
MVAKSDEGAKVKAARNENIGRRCGVKAKKILQ